MPDSDAQVRGLTQDDSEMVGIVQIILAQKRTSLAVLRTGVAIGLVPLSITTVLVTVSRFYDWVANLHFLVPMYLVLTGLTALSLYMLVRAIMRIRRQDRLLDRLSEEYPALRRYVR